jgi:thymidylate synthase
VHTLGDAHLYLNHIDQARLQLQRQPGQLPSLKMNPDKKDLFDFVFEDFELLDYQAQAHIAAPIAV